MLPTEIYCYLHATAPPPSTAWSNMSLKVHLCGIRLRTALLLHDRELIPSLIGMGAVPAVPSHSHIQGFFSLQSGFVHLNLKKNPGVLRIKKDDPCLGIRLL